MEGFWERAGQWRSWNCGGLVFLGTEWEGGGEEGRTGMLETEMVVREVGEKRRSEEARAVVYFWWTRVRRLGGGVGGGGGGIVGGGFVSVGGKGGGRWWVLG